MRLYGALILILSCVAPASHAEIVSQSGLTVVRLLSDSANFGGCMALVDNFNNPAGCAPRWVTFDCDGVHGSKEAGRRAYEIAQMAYALEKNIYISVETTQTINGYCAVKRIDLIK